MPLPVRQEDGLSESATIKNLPNEAGVDALTELALNLHWSWNHAADVLWEGLDKELWEATQNPWVILRTVSQRKDQRIAGRANIPSAS